MIYVDLNCDVGEGIGHDSKLMPLITSANIACGAHAGDERTMRETMLLAQRHGVGVGAHPGYEDREHFGRVERPIEPRTLRALVIRQIISLRALGAVRHVKPHGALYNLAARDRTVAEVIADAVREVDPSLMLFALAGSELVRAGQDRGLAVAEEAFADRSYQRDGSLTARTEPNAVHTDKNVVVAQVLQMLRTGMVRAIDGVDVKMNADTICLHGDGPNAVMFAVELRRGLAEAGIGVRPFTPA